MNHLYAPRGWLAWINQPSTLQCCHELHGELIIAVPNTNNTVTAWFLDGRSMRIPQICISDGWPKHLKKTKG
jgi:hypothetical protein